MADINLTQAEADVLIAMEKQRTDNRVLKFPDPGDRLTIPLISADRREAFTLDVTRGRISSRRQPIKIVRGKHHSDAVGSRRSSAPKSGR
jgi:hypothetical protein